MEHANMPWHYTVEQGSFKNMRERKAKKMAALKDKSSKSFKLDINARNFQVKFCLS